MTEQNGNTAQYDSWIGDESEFAALVFRQSLMPVEGMDAVFFPPTYPMDGGAGYNIDRFDDGTSVCQIDSVGSQANRMEPIFSREPYARLVPQVIIQAEGREINLVEAGHRAADAIVRFSTLGPQLHEAFEAYRKDGNAMPLARIAPTSLVFGAWDSRATQVKLPRIVRAVVRAYNVKVLTRSAQYTTIAGEILTAGEAEVTTRGPKAELGLAHVPAVRTHGGVRLEPNGEIRREAIVNLTALRALGGPTNDKTDETLVLRRYILGLALVSITSPMKPSLREGCELVPVPDKGATWELVKHDGTRSACTITHEEALDFATSAAAELKVESKTLRGTFNPKLVNKVLNLSEDDRKRLLRAGPVTEEAIEELTKSGQKSDLSKKSIKELKAECKKLGLPTDGTEDELIQRLRAAQAASSATAENGAGNGNDIGQQ
jgi:CRISPR-associated protein Csb1